MHVHITGIKKAFYDHRITMPSTANVIDAYTFKLADKNNGVVQLVANSTLLMRKLDL